MGEDFTPTLAIDFDKTIHAYSLGWHDGTAYDEPVPGAIEALELLLRDFTVYVFTTRPVEDTAEWLRRHVAVPVLTDMGERFWNQRDALLVTNRKLPCVALIDDRAIRFTSWPQALADLKRFTSWSPDAAPTGD